jgi:cytochrome c553
LQIKSIEQLMTNPHLTEYQKKQKPSYTLEELLSKCSDADIAEEDREWLDAKPVGRELI